MKLAEAIKDLPNYFYTRGRVIWIYLSFVLQGWLQIFTNSKSFVVSRLFWGRGRLYRSSFHLIAISFTAILAVVGLWHRANLARYDEQALVISYGQVGNHDLLQQGGNLTTVLTLDETQADYTVYHHRVQDGETLASIAGFYGVTEDTIRWANDKLISPFNDKVLPGWTLEVPQMNGVLYEVSAGESVNDVLASVENSNLFDVVELNGLVPPNYDLSAGQKLFVPNGSLPPPPPPIPVANYGSYAGSGGYYDSGVTVSGQLGSWPAGAFNDPLTHPACAGYSYSRGFFNGHDGVDLAKGGGCPIRAIAAGTVTSAGWSPYGGGFSVTVDHGGGVVSKYLHGSGQIWVRRGDYVYKGQELMYMGCTGNCTGTHLHLTLQYQGISIDPAPYVPYTRY